MVLPVHEACGEPLYTPRIYFKKKGNTITETIQCRLWCRKCKKFVKVELKQTG